MENDILSTLARLSDAELVTRVKSLATRERDATAHLVAHLAELDTRDVYLREGYGSLFVYCRDVLRLSEGEAYNRIEVARAARRFPVILEMLVAGAVHLTAVRLLAPHLTAENHRDVLHSASGKKRTEVEKIVARLAPRPDAPASARRLPTPAMKPVPPPAPPPEPAGQVVPEQVVPEQVGPAAGSLPVLTMPRQPAELRPLSPDRYKLQLTISAETLEKLKTARDMLSHVIPSGDDAAVLDRALTALLDVLTRKRFAQTPRPRPQAAPGRKARSPYVPAAVKRTVWIRDGGRCAYVSAAGHRCGERRFVQFHHLDPRVLGGEATVDGIALRCRRHNDYEGRLYFGKRRRTDDGGRVREAAVPGGSDLFRNKSSAAERAADCRPDGRQSTPVNT